MNLVLAVAVDTCAPPDKAQLTGKTRCCADIKQGSKWLFTFSAISASVPLNLQPIDSSKHAKANETQAR